MATIQPVQDIFGFGRLAEAIRARRIEEQQAPIRAAQTELLQGRVQQQRQSLADLARTWQEQTDLQEAIQAAPGQDIDRVSLDFYRKRSPLKARQFEEMIFNRARDIAKFDPAGASEFLNVKTGTAFDFRAPEKFGKPFAAVTPEGRTVFARTGPGGDVQEVEGFIPPPKTGEIITATPEGGVTITRGVAAAPTVPKKVVRDLTTSIVNNENNLSRLDRIGEQFAPGFLTFGGRIGATLSALKSKAGVDLTPDEERFLKDRRRFTQNINQLFNAYRKEITGAAASVQELESLKKAMLSEDLSPAEFQAAFSEFRNELQRANRLSRRILREGVPGEFGKNLDSLFTAGEDDDADARGQELMAQGLTEDEAFDQLIKEGF